MNIDTVKKLLIVLSVAFVLVSIWTNPSGSAHAAGAFLSSVGDFLRLAWHKSAEFARGLDD